MNMLMIWLDAPWAERLAALLVGVLALLWLVDAVRLRRAADRLDAAYQRLAREPRWSPLEPSALIGPAVLARLDAWEATSAAQFGFVPLTRLREHFADGELLGVRSVTISDDRTIVATFACSHVRPEVAFRSFASIVADKFLLVGDHRTISSRPEHFVVESFGKQASSAEMLERLRELRQAQATAAVPFADADSYSRFQAQMWRDAHALRGRQDYIVEIAALRKLAPPTMSDARLRRLHRYIVRRHQRSAG